MTITIGGLEPSQYGRYVLPAFYGPLPMTTKNILRRKAVLAKTGLSSVTIWRLEKAGRFPRRIQLGSNSVGWVAEEVDAWVQQRQRVGGKQSSANQAMFAKIFPSLMGMLTELERR